jgi:hypothetical protein
MKNGSVLSNSQTASDDLLNANPILGVTSEKIAQGLALYGRVFQDTLKSTLSGKLMPLGLVLIKKNPAIIAVSCLGLSFATLFYLQRSSTNSPEDADKAI